MLHQKWLWGSEGYNYTVCHDNAMAMLWFLMILDTFSLVHLSPPSLKTSMSTSTWSSDSVPSIIITPWRHTFSMAGFLNVSRVSIRHNIPNDFLHMFLVIFQLTRDWKGLWQLKPCLASNRRATFRSCTWKDLRTGFGEPDRWNLGRNPVETSQFDAICTLRAPSQ